LQLALDAAEVRAARAVEVDHHFCRPLLVWTDAPIICGKSKLPLDGKLHTGAIQNLALNLKRH
jgi:hypothetical protein